MDLTDFNQYDTLHQFNTLVDLYREGAINIYAHNVGDDVACSVVVLPNDRGITQNHFPHSNLSIQIFTHGHLATTGEIREAYDLGTFAN